MLKSYALGSVRVNDKVSVPLYAPLYAFVRAFVRVSDIYHFAN